MHLHIQDLWKAYPNGVVALRGVTLDIPPGMFGLLGPNGAGKSTLMRILATLQEADAGAVRLGEVDVLRDRDAVRRTLGYLPQEFGLYPRITAEAMLDHFALLKGLTNARERRETVAALLQQTNLYAARKQKLGGFSGGMRQRFGIAVALIGNPRLIIVDEPTAGLDPAERARFLNLLSELGESAVVILSTHIVEDVSDLCTRMAIIESGRILLEGEPVRAVESLRGRVWRRGVDRADLPRWEASVPVISTTLTGGRTVIHVHADASPGPGFEPVEPDLKDVYFTVIRGIQVGLHRPAAPAPLAPDGPDRPDAAQSERGFSGDAPASIPPTISALPASDAPNEAQPDGGFSGDAPGTTPPAISAPPATAVTDAAQPERGFPADAPGVTPPVSTFAATPTPPAEPVSGTEGDSDTSIDPPANRGGTSSTADSSVSSDGPAPASPAAPAMPAAEEVPPAAPLVPPAGGPGRAHVPVFGEWPAPREEGDETSADDPERPGAA